MSDHLPDFSFRHLTCLAAGLLVAAIGCGDDTQGAAGGGGAGGSPTTSSSTGDTTSTTTITTTTTTTTTGGDGGSGGAGGAGGTGGAGGDGGSGGAGGAGGGPDVTPELVSEPIGTPGWEPVDFHLFSVEVGDEFANFGTIITGLLPPPDHEQHPDLGVGPGAAHDGFESELATNVAAEGYVDQAVFTEAQGLLPLGIMGTYMLVPSAGAPEGSSPDFAAGPIIPNALFPLAVSVETFQDGVSLKGYSYGFDVPALDDALDPPFDVDGHSHIPLFDALVLDGLEEASGELEVHINLLDADGEGYDLTYTITVE